ncbi:MAG: DNA polymerase, partial [Bryobacteraceae bacterium]
MGEFGAPVRRCRHSFLLKSVKNRLSCSFGPIRRFLADIHSPNRALRMAAERIARNTPIQGTAADIL